MGGISFVRTFSKVSPHNPAFAKGYGGHGKCGVTLLKHTIPTCLLFLISTPSFAAHSHKQEHGGQVFHKFQLETDYGAGQDGAVASWDFDGWVGKDDNKLWLMSEGEKNDGTTEQSEFWAMASHTISTFWDVQAGVRHDTQPESTTYLIFGFDGLAPYFFDTEAHLFISDDGDVSARIRQENDFLVTQRLILQPYVEINLFAQDVEEQQKGAGLSNAEIGLQTRYETTRTIAPYLDLRYERKFGETASLARQEGEGRDDFITSAGLRLMF